MAIVCTLDKAVNDLIKHYRDTGKRVKAAKARALFRTAYNCKKYAAPLLEDKFTIRGNNWPARQLKIFPPTISAINKAGAGSVEIGTSDPSGVALNDGGSLFRKDGGLFPVPAIGGARKTKTARAQKLEKVLYHPKAFVVDAEWGFRKKFVFLRTKRYKRGTGRDPEWYKRGDVRLMFRLYERVPMDKHWNLDQYLAEYLAQNFEEEFSKAFEWVQKNFH